MIYFFLMQHCIYPQERRISVSELSGLMSFPVEDKRGHAHFPFFDVQPRFPPAYRLILMTQSRITDCLKTASVCSGIGPENILNVTHDVSEASHKNPSHGRKEARQIPRVVFSAIVDRINQRQTTGFIHAAILHFSSLHCGPLSTSVSTPSPRLNT